jgi:SNF2 family DNA or RNA helicase
MVKITRGGFTPLISLLQFVDYVFIHSKSGGVKGLSNELMQLRKICQHPFLFESVEDKISPSGFIDEKIVRTSGKLELLNRILPKFFRTGHRVIIQLGFHVSF